MGTRTVRRLAGEQRWDKQLLLAFQGVTGKLAGEPLGDAAGERRQADAEVNREDPDNKTETEVSKADPEN